MRRAAQWLILLICGILIASFSRSVSDLLTKGKVMDDARNRLERVQKEHVGLQRELEDVQNSAFIEKQAREKLNMAKKGEVVVIVPSIAISPTPLPTNIPTAWKQWVGLFQR